MKAIIPVSLLLGLSVAACCASPSVQLSTYPQKVRTFYALTDTNVPSALRSGSSGSISNGITVRLRANDGATWEGTTNGLMRIDSAAPQRDRRQYMAGKRYLPDDDVRQIVPDARAGVWVRTKTGVSHIELRPMTMAQKAETFEQRLHARHDRYGLVGDSRFATPGDPASNQMVDNDNDGLWTSIYASAECFRYAVMKSPEALANARKSLEAILFLEKVAGERGFPARSYIRKGDPMPQGGEWHWTNDGQYYWKGDTSSDEIVGHFFVLAIACDLLPDAELKQRMVATARRIMDHILDHKYTLVDLDGKPTTWGWWSPEALLKDPDERALNSLQLLSFLKTAAHLTGEARFEKEYRRVAYELKYADWITRLQEFRREMNYSDEELAMLPFYSLFLYEKDAAWLKAYRTAVDAWWQNMQRECNPLWTFIYLLGRPDAGVDLPCAVWTLYRAPMEGIHWTVKNSHRTDIEWSPEKDRFGVREAITLLPPDERPVMRWNANPFVVDGGNDGRSEDDGAAFLLSYWLGRYHKFLIGE